MVQNLQLKYVTMERKIKLLYAEDQLAIRELYTQILSRNGFDVHAVENGVSRVHILDGRMAHCLLLEIFTNKGIGTAILGDEEAKFDHE